LNYFLSNIREIAKYIYISGFNSNIYISGNAINSNKVDILIGNHFNYLDFLIACGVFSTISDDCIFVYANYVDNVPLLGRLFKNSNNISIKKKIESDKKNIQYNLKNINNTSICLYPEGTRLSSKNIFKSQKYSKENNLHTYNNILYPKMKGLYTIIEELHKQDKLGNIIDGTIKVEGLNIDDKNIGDFLKNNLKNTYVNIKTYKARYFDDYDKFKRWFIQIWDKKEDYLNDYNDFNKYDYKKVDGNIKISNIILTNLVIFIFLYFFYFIYIKRNQIVSSVHISTIVS
jgi:1-acyl-sn-glycerol-3-phosphate acyltransferase